MDIQTLENASNDVLKLVLAKLNPKETKNLFIASKKIKKEFDQRSIDRRSVDTEEFWLEKIEQYTSLDKPKTHKQICLEQYAIEMKSGKEILSLIEQFKSNCITIKFRTFNNDLFSRYGPEVKYNQKLYNKLEDEITGYFYELTLDINNVDLDGVIDDHISIWGINNQTIVIDYNISKYEIDFKEMNVKLINETKNVRFENKIRKLLNRTNFSLYHICKALQKIPKRKFDQVFREMRE